MYIQKYNIYYRVNCVGNNVNIFNELTKIKPYELSLYNTICEFFIMGHTIIERQLLYDFDVLLTKTLKVMPIRKNNFDIYPNSAERFKYISEKLRQSYVLLNELYYIEYVAFINNDHQELAECRKYIKEVKERYEI